MSVLDRQSVPYLKYNLSSEHAVHSLRIRNCRELRFGQILCLRIWRLFSSPATARTGTRTSEIGGLIWNYLVSVYL